MHGERPAGVPLGETRPELCRPFLMPPVPGGHGGACTLELPADRRTDARGAPGDQGHPAGQGAFHSCLSFLCDRHRSSLPACFGVWVASTIRVRRAAGQGDERPLPQGRWPPESRAIIVVCWEGATMCRGNTPEPPTAKGRACDLYP